MHRLQGEVGEGGDRAGPQGEEVRDPGEDLVHGEGLDATGPGGAQDPGVGTHCHLLRGRPAHPPHQAGEGRAHPSHEAPRVHEQAGVRVLGGVREVTGGELGDLLGRRCDPGGGIEVGAQDHLRREGRARVREPDGEGVELGPGGCPSVAEPEQVGVQGSRWPTHPGGELLARDADPLSRDVDEFVQGEVDPHGSPSRTSSDDRASVPRRASKATSGTCPCKFRPFPGEDGTVPSRWAILSSPPRGAAREVDLGAFSAAGNTRRRATTAGVAVAVLAALVPTSGAGAGEPDGPGLTTRAGLSTDT